MQMSPDLLRSPLIGFGRACKLLIEPLDELLVEDRPDLDHLGP